MSHDPIAVVAAALDRLGCQPSGPSHQSTALCPAHEDRSPSLSVGIGADGRALLHCHAGCAASAVVEALGLTWPELFPDGHRHAGRRRSMPTTPVETADPVVEILAALSMVGIAWRNTTDHRMFVASVCPSCGACGPGALWVTYIEKRALLCCFRSSCTFEEILSALEIKMTTAVA